MKTFIILPHIGFDWSGQEYGIDYVNNIYLGMGTYKTKELAEVHGNILLEEYCKEEDQNSPVLFESSITVQEEEFNESDFKLF